MAFTGYDYSSGLGALGKGVEAFTGGLKQRAEEQAMREALSNLPMGADGKPDLQAAAMRLVGVGQVRPAVTLANLGASLADRETANRQWQATHELQKQNADRSARQQDRSFGLQERQLKLSEARADTSTPEGRARVAGQYGLQPGTPDYQQYVINGKIPTAAEKAPTEGQSNAALYANRMMAAEKIFADPKIAEAQTSIKERAAGAVPVIGNFLVSADYQRAEQAQRDFVNATLRRESGAVINKDEFDNARRQYFPQPGDSPQVLAQKAANRRNAIDGIASAAGPALKKLENRQGDNSPSSPAMRQPESQPKYREGQRARNPSTGAIIEFRNGQWSPVQ